MTSLFENNISKKLDSDSKITFFFIKKFQKFKFHRPEIEYFRFEITIFHWSWVTLYMTFKWVIKWSKRMLIHKNRNFPAKNPSFDIFFIPLMKHTGVIVHLMTYKIKKSSLTCVIFRLERFRWVRKVLFSEFLEHGKKVNCGKNVVNRGKIVVNHAKNRYLPPDGIIWISFRMVWNPFGIFLNLFCSICSILPHFYHTFTIFKHIPYFFSTLEEFLRNHILRVPDDHLYLYASRN